MPAFRRCPKCGFDGAHGFDGMPHGIQYYHGECRYIVTDWGATFMLPGQFRDYIQKVRQRDKHFDDPRWGAYMLSGGDKREWVRQLQLELGCSALEARRIRDKVW